MSPVQVIYNATKELIHYLKNSGEEDRDLRLQYIDQQLGIREEAMKRLSPPFSQQEEELGRDVMQLNDQLMKLLKHEQAAIQKDINNVQNKKEARRKYVNPYQALHTDGVFFDKKN